MIFSMDAGSGFSHNARGNEEKTFSHQDGIDLILKERDPCFDSRTLQMSYLHEMVARFSFAQFCLANADYQKAEKEIKTVKNLTMLLNSEVTDTICQEMLDKIENLKTTAFHPQSQP